MTKELYKKTAIPAGTALEACPVCGAAAELWQFSEKTDEPTTKVVMCSNGDALGPQIKDGSAVFVGCLLYMPPEAFYRARAIDAVKYWNDYARALTALREANHHDATLPLA